MVDRAALRSVFGVGMMEPITHKYKENKILNLEELNKLYIAKFMFRLFKGEMKGDFKEIWPRIERRVNRENLRNINDFDQPQHIRFETLKKHPLFSYPEIFNKLPNDFKNVRKVTTFSNSYKKYLLNGGDLREVEEIVNEDFLN